MPGYDAWKTRSPDDDMGGEQLTPEQERADYEDQMQQEAYKNCPCGGWDCSALPGGPLRGCPYDTPLSNGPRETPNG